MTAEAFSGVPFSAGAAVASTAGRLALSGVALFMRAPLRNTAVAGLVLLSAMAGSNALYKQAHHHPSPLFGNFETTAESQGADPVMPAAKPKKLEAVTEVAKPAVAQKVSASKIVGNDDVLDIQRKLQAFGMLDGKVDGLFGPRTIRAIKAFEAKVGKPAKGELTAEIVALIKSTSAFDAIDTAPAAAVDPIAASAEPVPLAAQQAVNTAPLALAATPAKLTAQVVEPVEESKPLPAPEPLLSAPVAVEPAVAVAEAETTATIEPAAVTPMADASTPAPNAVTKRSVQTIAVRAAHAAPATPQAMPDALDPAVPAVELSIDPKTVASVQRGLASLGFLHGEPDGVAGETTSKAIRNFEIYFNYDVTGRITPDLVKLLVQNGAVI